jgi:hypothetical protein
MRYLIQKHRIRLNNYYWSNEDNARQHIKSLYKSRYIIEDSMMFITGISSNVYWFTSKDSDKELEDAEI